MYCVLPNNAAGMFLDILKHQVGMNNITDVQNINDLLLLLKNKRFNDTFAITSLNLSIESFLLLLRHS